jgi:hypothetical protein
MPTFNSSSTTNFLWLSLTDIWLSLCSRSTDHITENPCHVIAIQPVHWRAGWTYRKHVTWPLPTVVWPHRGYKENTAPVLLAACVLRALPSNRFTSHIIVEIFVCICRYWIVFRRGEPSELGALPVADPPFLPCVASLNYLQAREKHRPSISSYHMRLQRKVAERDWIKQRHGLTIRLMRSIDSIKYWRRFACKCA